MTVLTKEELEAIQKRAEAATPGPWFWLDDGRLYSDGADKVIGEVIEGKDETWFDLFDANAEFIAHAREDIPKLFSLVEYQQAELERLNDVIKQLTETTESFLDDKHFYMDELRKAKAEIDYLKNEQIYWRQENDRLRKHNERFYKALTGELRIVAEKDGKVIADLKGVRIESDNEA